MKAALLVECRQCGKQYNALDARTMRGPGGAVTLSANSICPACGFVNNDDYGQAMALADTGNRDG